VSSDDLGSIPGLEDKHLRVLARQDVTDVRGFLDADGRAIYQAMRNLRPRPTLEQISGWQDVARSMLEGAAPDVSEWHTAASFVVVFSQRSAGGTWERRVEAEQTEVEPERNLQVWSGWDCEPVCRWMLGQLQQTDSGPESTPAEEGSGTPAEEETAGSQAVPAVGRPQLYIPSAAIIDATGRSEIVTSGALVADAPTELVAPVRVVFTVSGARPGTRLQAVARILRRNGPGWNPQEPVAVPDSGQAEFDLATVPVGVHEMSLIAWAPDATAKPVTVRLPSVTIH
jgi:hypothetical protein